ncbi:MAG TPA: Ig-like domain-containing protein [Candidatus Dormibacteraeota bacterium]|nr:Ig-like domain-containing protein [Candidatus Dormibacteraeota bacterium]
MRPGLLVLMAMLAPMVAGCALNPPRIVSISPNREVADVPSNQPITITFDRPMNHGSVEQRFSLSPMPSGCQDAHNCRYAWTGNTFMFIHLHANFALTTLYTVSMHAGYADASGQQNTLEHVWRFTTERPPALSTVDPADGSTAIAPDRNLILTFSRPMRADSLPGAVTLTPDTPFLLRTRPGGDTSQFEIVPTTVLQANQAYTISIDRPTDVHGNPLTGRIQTRFRTGSLSLSRKIGYLMGQRGQPAFAIAMVDPHPDAFLGRSTPKQLYSLSLQSQATDALLAFDWSPDGKRLVVVDAPRDAQAGPIQLVDVATGTAVRPGINGSDVYWSPDGTILYLSGGVIHRFSPSTLVDAALTDSADGPVIPPLALSPDGKSVAYSTVDVQGNHLWLMNLDLRTRYRPVGLDDPADHPAWSPNGTKLAFRRVTSSGPQLWIYDLSASGASTYRQAGALDITGAAWLNDNSTLFAATGAGSSAALYRINIFSAGEAGGVVKVTGAKDAPNGSAPSTPAYDRRIGFVSQVDDLPQIFVMNGDGSRPLQLTQWEADYPYTGAAPNWIPTG